MIFYVFIPMENADFVLAHSKNSAGRAKSPLKMCLYNIICNAGVLWRSMKSIASGRCGLQRRNCYSFSFKHSWECSISKSSAQKTKFITVRHKNNHTRNINVTHNTHNLDRMKPSWSYRSPCVCVDSYSFLHWGVYWALLSTPGTPAPPPPPFHVSHIPSPATLIVFGHYFHCSAIVTGSNCSSRSKLV